MRILVIGGTLFIGKLLVKELLKAKHDVVIVHRKPGHDLGRRVGEIIADRNDPDTMREALRGQRFDVVFDNVYDWGRGTTAAQVEGTVRAFEQKLQRYVFMSSVAAYGDGLNHHEGDALAPDSHPDPYVRNKAMSERLLFRIHQRTGLPVVTLRPPFIYGPTNPFYREAFFWDRLRDGRPVIIPGDGRRLMQFVHVQDLVSVCLKAMDEPAAIGQAFNVANARPLTQVEVVEALAKAAGKKVNLVRVPRDRIQQAGGNAMVPPLYFGTYYDMPPITMVINKAQRLLRFKPVDFHIGLKETYRWYLRQKRQPQDYAFEDALVAMAQQTALPTV